MKTCKHGTNLGKLFEDPVGKNRTLETVECKEVNCDRAKTCSCNILEGRQCMLHFDLDMAIVLAAINEEDK